MNLNKKIVVRVIKDWEHIDLFSQTQDSLGNWNNFYFTSQNIEDVDIIVFLSPPFNDFKIKCREGMRFLFVQEPPINRYRWINKSNNEFDYIFTQFQLAYPNFHLSHGFLTWWIGKNYSFLKQYKISPTIKINHIATITSTDQVFKGQRDRINFISFLKNQTSVPLEVFGKGINEVSNKFDTLIKYKYCLAIENTQSEHYWTEKISDAFLSYCMPVYFGPPNITQYFPSESMILIDIHKPQKAIEIIKNALSQDLYTKNFESIKYARNLVLERYNLFPFIENLINKNASDILERKKVTYTFTKNYWSNKESIYNKVRKIFKI